MKIRNEIQVCLISTTIFMHSKPVEEKEEGKGRLAMCRQPEYVTQTEKYWEDKHTSLVGTLMKPMVQYVAPDSVTIKLPVLLQQKLLQFKHTQLKANNPLHVKDHIDKLSVEPSIIIHND